LNFTKMHGCGNDYVYIDCFKEKIEDPNSLAVSMSNRHFGVGSDGLVLILPSEAADFRMRMFNSDGSEAEMCGNAIRCIGKYVYDRGLSDKKTVSVETLAGIKILELHVKDGIVNTVTVDMGEPILEAEKIPVLSDISPIIDKEITALDKTFKFTCVSMGNPHAVTFIENTASFELDKYGSVLEIDRNFPKKSNIEFAEIIDDETIKMRVFERGAGETLACGTGACATAVAASLKGFCKRKVKVILLGGNLDILWDENDNHVYMTGPAIFTFDGCWLL